jgi:hypothetical protein
MRDAGKKTAQDEEDVAALMRRVMFGIEEGRRGGRGGRLKLYGSKSHVSEG